MSRQLSFRIDLPRLAGVIGALCLLVPVVVGWTSRDQAAAVRPGASRGEYLANSVAMCVQCHSPRDASGTIIPDRKFHGGPMPVRGPSWAGEWCYAAPPIAGLNGFTDEQFVMLLTEGHAGDRPAPKPPMPPFRMNREDAQAILQYLRSK
jgi:mono/diheme cytochrome c family protein